MKWPKLQGAYKFGRNGNVFPNSYTKDKLRKSVEGSLERLGIDALNLFEANNILEIGHGNCGHLDKIINKAKNIEYYQYEVYNKIQFDANNITDKVKARKILKPFDFMFDFKCDLVHKVYFTNLVCQQFFLIFSRMLLVGILSGI